VPKLCILCHQNDLNWQNVRGEEGLELPWRLVKIYLFIFKLIFYIFLYYFDMLILKIKKYYFNIFIYKIYFKNQSLELRLSIPFRFTRNSRNIPYQFKKRNKTKQFLSHFKSRSVPDFSAKFWPECSGFILYVPFCSWKVI
jgi:hypothetical protein